MQSVHYCETQATLSIAIIAKRINNGISLVLALVAIMGRKILLQIPKSLLRRGLLRFGGIGEFAGFGSGTERENESHSQAYSQAEAGSVFC